MEALRAAYGDDSSDSNSNSDSDNLSLRTSLQTSGISVQESKSAAPITTLPPPPPFLINAPNTYGAINYFQSGETPRVRSFPHVEGNYALHVFIPVQIPTVAKREMASFLKNVAAAVPGLHVVDVDIPVGIICRDERKICEVALGREFHISLGRTVPIRAHQIDSVVALLRQKLQTYRRCWIDFSRWEVFTNDDRTRSFLSIEVTSGGLAEINKQIEAVNGVYRLHNLPEFYKDPRPHISIAWVLGGASVLKTAIKLEMKKYGSIISSKKVIFSCKFNSIECKVGNKTYKICQDFEGPSSI